MNILDIRNDSGVFVVLKKGGGLLQYDPSYVDNSSNGHSGAATSSLNDAQIFFSKKVASAAALPFEGIVCKIGSVTI